VEPDFKSNTTACGAPLRAAAVLLYSRVPIKGFEAEKEQVQNQGHGVDQRPKRSWPRTRRSWWTRDIGFQNYRADALLTYHGKVGASKYD